jgi:leucyl aminopeptidase
VCNQQKEQNQREEARVVFKFSVVPFDPKRSLETAVIFACEKARLLPEGNALDRIHKGALAKALKNSRFQGGAGEVFTVAGLSDGERRVLVCGLGKLEEMKANDWRMRGLDMGKRIDELGLAEAMICLGSECGEVNTGVAAEALLEGLHLAVYRFDRFKTEQKPHQKAKFQRIAVAVDRDSVSGVKRALAGLKGLMAGSDLTRELVNLPPNIALPQYMADEAVKLADLGIRVDVLDEKRLKKLGMNLILAVGAGATGDQQPRLIVMKYRGAARDVPFRAVVGKGVMFDTGGYNLKPTGSMETMKCDMAGAGAVMGLMKALALRRSRVNVIGVCGCAVNMVSDKAYLPSAILTSYKGLTVEIGNTDAEGRLVLADAIAYVIDKENPGELIDLATLTGACMVALGGQYAGLFSTDDGMAEALLASGERTGERLWRMPVDDAFAAKPQLADASNDGKRYGGASTGAVFLKKFAGETPWAHLDIAGVALSEKLPEPFLQVKGATGFGVRLLVDYLENRV